MKKILLSIGLLLALFVSVNAQSNGATLNLFFQPAGSDATNWYVDVMMQAGANYVTNNADYGSTNAMGSWQGSNLRFTASGLTASSALASTISVSSSLNGITTGQGTFVPLGGCYATEPAFNITLTRAAPAADAGSTPVAIARVTFPKSSFPSGTTLTVRNTTTQACASRETFWTNPLNVANRQLVGSTLTTILPLKLLSFSAIKQSGATNTALLSWTVAEQVNTRSFEVERSTNGVDYSKVGTVAAAGTYTGKQTYSFTDANAATATNYYRLKMVDIDGKFTYSPVKTVRFDGTATENVYLNPNPTRGQFSVKGLTATSIVRVLDMTGKVLQTYNGINQFSTLNISQLPSAVYLVQVIEEGKFAGTFKLVKE